MAIIPEGLILFEILLFCQGMGLVAITVVEFMWERSVNVSNNYRMSNIIDLEPLEEGAYPAWRTGLELRQGSGNPPWGSWLTFREGTPPLLHGRRETERAVRWITRPRWPGEELVTAAYWSILRAMDLPGRPADPMLVPWEVQALYECIVSHVVQLIRPLSCCSSRLNY